MDPIKEYKHTRQLLFEEWGIKPYSKIVDLKSPFDKIHYLEMGSGRPLILVHGGGSHSSEWIPILKPLADHFHLYVVDRPGCGLSAYFGYENVDVSKHAAEFINSFMSVLGLQKASFLAQSMGGYFSLCFAMKHPERVDRLILIGAPAGMNRRIPLMLRLMGTPVLNNLLLSTVAKPSRSNVRNIHKQLLVKDISKLSDTYLDHSYYAQLVPGCSRSFVSLLENELTLRGWEEKYYVGDSLKQLKIPVHFIWGANDAFEKSDSGLPKAANIKDYQFEVVDDAGHCPWLDKPTECASLTVSMLS